MLTKAHIEAASFNEGSLRGAWLNEAHLERASHGKARLDEALVDRAHLEGAWLSGASFYGASLSDTQLVDALLDGAFLGKAESLAQTQLEAAWGEDTTLPDGYTRPRSEQWLPKVFDMDNLDDRWGHWKARHEFWRSHACGGGVSRSTCDKSCG